MFTTLSLIAGLGLGFITPSYANTCTPLPLDFESYKDSKIHSKDNAVLDLRELKKVITSFEKSFFNNKPSQFINVVHPAIKKSESEKTIIFQSTLLDFGLKSVRLQLSEVFLLQLEGNGLEAQCPTGTARGVVGPKLQTAVFHTAIVNNNQVKILTLWAPVLKPEKESTHFPFDVGLTMVHGYNGTIYGNTVKDLLSFSKINYEKKFYLKSWLEIEAARKILQSTQPYWSPLELNAIATQSKEIKDLLVKEPSFKSAIDLASQDAGSQIADITSVYQSDQIVPGLKIRVHKDDPFNTQQTKCEKAVKRFRKETSEETKDYKGLECLVYTHTEPLSQIPSLGSQFIKN